MKYLEVDGVGRVSRIGLGTWQFGSREWGYGDQYASGAAGDIVQRALAMGVTLFDTAEIYGTGKSERILGEALGDERADGCCSQQDLPNRAVPPSGQAARARQCAAVAAGANSALPGPPAQPGGSRFGDHAGNAQPARQRRHRRGRRLELFACAMAEGRRRARTARHQQPGGFLTCPPPSTRATSSPSPSVRTAS